MKLLRGVIPVVVALAFVACAPAAEEAIVEEGLTVEEARAIAEGYLEQWDAASSAGGADALAMLYADEGVRMHADVPAWIGNAAIREGFAETIGQGPGDQPGSWTTGNVVDDVAVAGEWIVARGSWTATFMPEGGGEPVSESGKWMSLLGRQPDGTWKTVWDIWNRDAPLATQ